MLPRVGVGGFCKVAYTYTGSCAPGRWFPPAFKQSIELTRLYERLPCVQQLFTRHLLYHIIHRHVAVFQTRVPFRSGTRDILPTDVRELSDTASKICFAWHPDASLPSLVGNAIIHPWSILSAVFSMDWHSHASFSSPA